LKGQETNGRGDTNKEFPRDYLGAKLILFYKGGDWKEGKSSCDVKLQGNTTLQSPPGSGKPPKTVHKRNGGELGPGQNQQAKIKAREMGGYSQSEKNQGLPSNQKDFFNR